MTIMPEWHTHLCEAVGWIQTRYHHIGRKTGAPFLAVVYPPDIEPEVFREWDAQIKSLNSEFLVRELDLLEITRVATNDIGLDTVLETLEDPAPGCNPEQELANLWLTKIAEEIQTTFRKMNADKPVIVLKSLAALYPVTGPQMLMQRLWDKEQESLEGPVVLLIPGTLTEPRRYSFLNQVDEYMYRGDIL
jgi:hypothetical protein